MYTNGSDMSQIKAKSDSTTKWKVSQFLYLINTHIVYQVSKVTYTAEVLTSRQSASSRMIRHPVKHLS